MVTCLSDLRRIPKGSFDEFISDRRHPLASDAALRRALEALFDVARHLLAKGKDLAGLEFREVATLARQHGLIQDAGLADRFHAMAGYRDRLTHHYEKVTELELFGIVSQHLGDIEAIAESLRAAAADFAKRS